MSLRSRPPPVPAHRGVAERHSPQVDRERPSLRIAATRGQLGLELDGAFALGPLRVIELALALPGLKFPIDLSGGVARFRNRRGALTSLALEVSASELARWIAPRVRGLLGQGTPDVLVAPLDADAVLVGLRHGSSSVAFDVIVAPREGDLRFVVESARGLGLDFPPHLLATRALAAIARGLGAIEGSALVVDRAASAIARELLPAAGARAPAAANLRFDVPSSRVTTWAIEASIDRAPPALSPRATSAVELAALARDADQACFEGDLDRARRAYLELLERAPRHVEIVRRLAALDHAVGGRAEAALATLASVVPVAFGGVLGGELLAAVGDRGGAHEALARAAENEPYGPLAALALLRASTFADGPGRLVDLDRALARSPGLDLARWARLEARLDRGEPESALADAEHLEANARGAEARHEVWRRAAAAFLDRGFVREATPLFERALRYAPENPSSLLGLARALEAAGRPARALDVARRAIALAERKGESRDDAIVRFARLLVEVAGDRPAAIARVREVPAGSAEAFEARALEGAWRAELGDLAGAHHAFARLADLVEAATLDADVSAKVAALLLDAARVEEEERGDRRAAARFVGLAVRLRPRDAAAAKKLRRLAVEPEPHPPMPASIPAPSTEAPGSPAFAPAAALTAPPPPDVDDETRAVELADKLRANPSDHAVAMELAGVLERLGRDLDLLALLSARIDEGSIEEQTEVVPLRRATLLRLAVAARRDGRASEAELYETMARS